ncbi:amidase [Ornithinimicrobium cerasi]|uniref:amidase n=1 Tax=Ornithinimicrobium cerasi TaxID=2248773 RepID=UPI000EFE97EF|nr:amidase family protein [Ornithinimicrobium cerasi]
MPSRSPLLAAPGTPSAVELARLLRTRELSAREALEQHLDRIGEVDPEINAVVTLAEDRAREGAAAADERAVRASRAGEPLPLLHGIPMTHKDTHATRGIRTTMGSPLLRDHVPTHDEIVVGRLRAAGVVSTGKNNVPEFAAGSHTVNEVFGATRNPHDPRLSAGGSTGGGAAALAAGIQSLADGSDMGGSLRNPASFCGVVGLRPSAGVVPSGPNQNPRAWLAVAGPMARTVDDVILMLAATAGPDPRVPLPCPADAAAFSSLLAERVADDLRGLRVGTSTDLGLDLPLEPGIAAAVDRAAGRLVALGAQVEESCPDLSGADRVFDVQRALDMALALGPTIQGHRDDGTVKADVVWNVDRGLALTGADVVAATLARGRLDAAVRGWFADHDLLLLPTSQVLPFPVWQRWPTEVAGRSMGSYVEWMRSCSVVSATGCPSVSLPAGYAVAPGGGEVPVGVQLVAAPGRDVNLLRVARILDRYRPVI